MLFFILFKNRFVFFLFLFVVLVWSRLLSRVEAVKPFVRFLFVCWKSCGSFCSVVFRKSVSLVLSVNCSNLKLLLGCRAPVNTARATPCVRVSSPRFWNCRLTTARLFDRNTSQRQEETLFLLNTDFSFRNLIGLILLILDQVWHTCFNPST